jgi:hypothetical protein
MLLRSVTPGGRSVPVKPCGQGQTVDACRVYASHMPVLSRALSCGCSVLPLFRLLLSLRETSRHFL